METGSDFDDSSHSDCGSNSNSGGSNPSSPTSIPKDLPLIDRVNQSVTRRARRVKRAIERKAKGPKTVSIEDVTGLHDSAERGDLARLKSFVLEKGIDPNTRAAGNGTTALHTAVRRRDVPMIEFLLSCKGIDVNALDNDKKPALAFARRCASSVVGGESGSSATLTDGGASTSTITNASPLSSSSVGGEAAAGAGAGDDTYNDGDDAVGSAIANLLTSHGAMDDDAYFQDTADGKQLQNTLESSDVIDSQLIRKVIVTVALPFVFLVFVNGIWFAIKFLVVSVVFYFTAFGYFISEVMIKPPWWFHTPNGKALRLTGCPDYWEGKLHNPKRDLKLDYTDITVTTHDGITIRGWFIPSTAPKERQSKMCIVCVHGGGRDRRAWLRHAPFLAAAGYGCILFDMRDHGLSGGPSRGLMFGMKERYDLVAVAAYARDRLGFKYVCAMGTSVGASTCIMAAAIDPKIDMVVAENPLLTAAHLQDKHIQKIFGPYFTHARYSEVIFSVFRFMCSNWLNFKLYNKPSKRCQAVHVISKIAPRPVLLMHGTLDDVVPFYHSETLFSHAKEPKELWLVPEAVHCCLYNKAKEEFEYHVLRFLAKHDPTLPEAERVVPDPPKGVAGYANNNNNNNTNYASHASSSANTPSLLRSPRPIEQRGDASALPASYSAANNTNTNTNTNTRTAAAAALSGSTCRRASSVVSVTTSQVASAASTVTTTTTVTTAVANGGAPLLESATFVASSLLLPAMTAEDEEAEREKGGRAASITTSTEVSTADGAEGGLRQRVSTAASKAKDDI